MKTIAKFSLIILITGSVFASCAVRGGFTVRERLVEPYYVQPAPPYAGAIWIPGEWEWRGNHYVYLRGYYIRPSYSRQWVPGHWREVPGGFVWDKGHWRQY